MKCPQCQHENRPGAKFCEECATPLAKDMAIVARLAKELEVPLPEGETAESLYALANRNGMAQQDITALSPVLEQKQV